MRFRTQVGSQVAWAEGDAQLLAAGRTEPWDIVLSSDLFRRTLRRVVVLAGMLVLLACAARAADGSPSDAASIGAEQSTATGPDQLPVHVLDQADPSQYQEV